MKILHQRILGVLVVLLALTSCQKEMLQPEEAPQIQALSPVPYCGPLYSTPLADATGSTEQTYCGPTPCATPAPDYGTAYWYNNENGDFAVEFQLAAGWFADEMFYVLDPANNVGTDANGIPIVSNDWQSLTLIPYTSTYNVSFPSSSIAQCFELGLKVNAFKLAFFGNIDPNSRRSLYPVLNGAYTLDVCQESCLYTVTAGECENCDSEITVAFNGCNSIEVTSCQNINNVVVMYTDCSWDKFTAINGTSFSFPGIGKDISHVYVKSGCTLSHEGPGFGRRFDGPCVNEGCGHSF